MLRLRFDSADCAVGNRTGHAVEVRWASVWFCCSPLLCQHLRPPVPWLLEKWFSVSSFFRRACLWNAIYWRKLSKWSTCLLRVLFVWTQVDSCSTLLVYFVDIVLQYCDSCGDRLCLLLYLLWTGDWKAGLHFFPESREFEIRKTACRWYVHLDILHANHRVEKVIPEVGAAPTRRRVFRRCLECGTTVLLTAKYLWRHNWTPCANYHFQFDFVKLINVMHGKRRRGSEWSMWLYQ